MCVCVCVCVCVLNNYFVDLLRKLLLFSRSYYRSICCLFDVLKVCVCVCVCVCGCVLNNYFVDFIIKKIITI